MHNSKNFKRVISLSAAAVCMMSALSFSPAAVESDAAALTAFEITEDMKIGWNLGNTLDATASKWDSATKTSVILEHAGVESETSWGNPVTTKAMIDAVKAKGFNTVRVPTTWFQHLDSDNNIDSEWIARVKEVVDYCIDNDMYVILNLHHEEWVDRADLGTAYDEMKPKFLKIWSQIATEFKDYDQHLIFESMNEPRAKGTSHEWWGPQQNEVDTINKLNADFVNLIRSTDSPYSATRLLMLPGYCASSDSTIYSKIEVPEDDYVAISIHAYSPYSFTMDTSTSDHSTFTEANAAELSNILENIRKTFIEKDIPVVIGEFGASNFDNTDARVEWAKTYLTTAKEYGIPCVLWDNNVVNNPSSAGECHGYFNRSSLSWYEVSEPVVDKMMSVLADESIVWGGQKEGVKYDHDDIDTGKQLLSSSVNLDKSDENTAFTNVDVTWAILEGGDVAVKYTGDSVYIALTDGNWKGWTEVQPYDVDEENGIAYFSATVIENAWGGDTSEIAHLFVGTTGKSTVSKIAVIGGADVIDDTPEDNTIKYDLDFTKSTTSKDTLVLDFYGTADTYANGCVGYMNGADWEMIEWEGTFKDVDGRGFLEITIPVSEIPEGVTSGQAQVWWSDAEITGFQYYFANDSEPATTTTETETSTTTTTTTTTTENSTTTTTTEVDTGLIYGDVNFDHEVNIADAVLILQSLANPDDYTLSDNANKYGDVVGNDGVTALDALAIQMVEAKALSQADFPLDKLPE